MCTGGVSQCACTNFVKVHETVVIDDVQTCIAHSLQKKDDNKYQCSKYVS